MNKLRSAVWGGLGGLVRLTYVKAMLISPCRCASLDSVNIPRHDKIRRLVVEKAIVGDARCKI